MCKSPNKTVTFLTWHYFIFTNNAQWGIYIVFLICATNAMNYPYYYYLVCGCWDSMYVNIMVRFVVFNITISVLALLVCTFCLCCFLKCSIVSLGECGSSKLFSVCVCVSLFHGFYLDYYGSDFYEIWWVYLNVGPIDRINI